MTVLELTNRLLHLDPDMMVVISGYEGGVTEIKDIKEISVHLNANLDWWKGEHEPIDYDSKFAAKAIQLKGVRH